MKLFEGLASRKDLINYRSYVYLKFEITKPIHIRKLGIQTTETGNLLFHIDGKRKLIESKGMMTWADVDLKWDVGTHEIGYQQFEDVYSKKIDFQKKPCSCSGESYRYWKQYSPFMKIHPYKLSVPLKNTNLGINIEFDA